MGGGAWKAAVHGVAKSPTQLSDFTFTFHFHALEKEMATHSSVLAWRIPGMGEPGGLSSTGSHRVGHEWSDLAVVVVYTESQVWHKWTYLWSRKRLTIHRTDLWLPRRVGREELEFGVSRCKLLSIEWINNKMLLYSIGNYIQYPVIKP